MLSQDFGPTTFTTNYGINLKVEKNKAGIKSVPLIIFSNVVMGLI